MPGSGSSIEPSDEPPVRRSQLPGGLRVVTQQVPGVRSAAVGLWVGVGSRDESPALAGAAHFLEHLLFKATATRTALDIAEVVDAIGGELNAFTAKEHTCFYAHVLDEDVTLAIDLVADVVLRGRCRPVDVEVERQVVLEEIAMRDDDPEDLVGDLMHEAAFGGHPLGRSIIGSTESVGAMTATQLRSFHRRRYTPDRMVLAVAGNIDHAKVVRAARRFFADRLAAPPSTAPRRRPPRPSMAPSTATISRPGEQTHLVVATPTAGRADPDRRALSVLSTIIGGGLSSRAFQEVRERRGLAYSVYSSVETFTDAGLFSVYAGCRPDNVRDVVTVLDHLLADIVANGVHPEEVERAKGSLRGGLVLGLEDPYSRMARIGRRELDGARHSSLADGLAEIGSVTVDQVDAVARRVLTQPRSLAVIGPQRRGYLPVALRNAIVVPQQHRGPAVPS